ncbi:ribose 1,5-bisphosphokinase [Azomonas macrocytogenes]|uniref:Ribose 1,5-bisphosphate phosphokinase PhnN n=1 Tax=Azomonas macrocytogenes TaxID=69962 RepID=A0A839T192_AZOMA|nr:ribose 1,5-bisphosphokinase [Azomonas macrocytogenes]MBB3103311.1 ribose 1,5-bisphosphokinase [Azomonas macrocytogenes]
MGRLVYLMGASGVGKDSLLAALRELQPDWPVAHRYITRASTASENCITLSEAEFDWRRKAGLFCLDWQAHGLSYGIGHETEDWLAQAELVIVNGSRLHLPAARQRFGARLLPLLVVAEPQVIRQRLLARGRESTAEIEQRLIRRPDGLDSHTDLLRHDNSGTLADSVTVLQKTLQGWVDKD